jgi:LemA protein
MIPLVICVSLIIVFGIMYNTLIARKNEVIKSFGFIDVLLKKRYDLIPNLVETARQYMGYESRLLSEITDLRGKVVAPGITAEERLKLEPLLAQKLFSIMAVAENYPDLKANQSFIMLQSTWKDLEDHIASARAGYNASITRYNNTVEMFPTNIAAVLMDYKPKNLFEALPNEKEPLQANELFTK